MRRINGGTWINGGWSLDLFQINRKTKGNRPMFADGWAMSKDGRVWGGGVRKIGSICRIRREGAMVFLDWCWGAGTHGHPRLRCGFCFAGLVGGNRKLKIEYRKRGEGMMKFE